MNSRVNILLLTLVLGVAGVVVAQEEAKFQQMVVRSESNCRKTPASLCPTSRVTQRANQWLR